MYAMQMAPGNAFRNAFGDAGLLLKQGSYLGEELICSGAPRLSVDA